MTNILSKAVCLIVLLIISPVLIFISFAIIIDSGFPIFFRQKRVGKNNNYFSIYKFRTMKNGTPDIPTHKMMNSSSFYTSIGPFLRKYSLDELPQLFNILKGDMIFIGPRPALFNQSKLIHLRTNIGIQNLKPGITGWAQINGRDNINIEKKVLMDEFYLKNKSLKLDFKIILKTIFKVLKAENISK